MNSYCKFPGYLTKIKDFEVLKMLKYFTNAITLEDLLLATSNPEEPSAVYLKCHLDMDFVCRFSIKIVFFNENIRLTIKLS